MINLMLKRAIVRHLKQQAIVRLEYYKDNFLSLVSGELQIL